MTENEDYGTRLREHVDTLVPTFAVDTTKIVPRVQRRRAVVRTGGTAAVAAVLVATGWMVQAQPWATTEAPSAGAPFVPLDAPMPTPTVDPGWPDAAFWYSLSETETVMVGDEGGTHVERMETWRGHDHPGLLLTNGDPSTAAGVGPASWGEVVIDGERVLVDWDTLYDLPTEPQVLEQLLRDSVDPERGSGTDDDKIFEAVRGLLARSPAPPALRTALVDVVSGLPNVTVTPGSTDATGRSGTLVERRDETSTVYRLVIEPTTGRLLEESSTSENPPPAQPGVSFSTSWRSTYLEEGPADDTPVEPTLENSGCMTWETC